MSQNRRRRRDSGRQGRWLVECAGRRTPCRRVWLTLGDGLGGARARARARVRVRRSRRDSREWIFVAFRALCALCPRCPRSKDRFMRGGCAGRQRDLSARAFKQAGRSRRRSRRHSSSRHSSHSSGILFDRLRVPGMAQMPVLSSMRVARREADGVGKKAEQSTSQPESVSASLCQSGEPVRLTGTQ